MKKKPKKERRTAWREFCDRTINDTLFPPESSRARPFEGFINLLSNDQAFKAIHRRPGKTGVYLAAMKARRDQKRREKN